MTDTRQRFEAIVQNLKDHGHKLTPQRIAIVRMLAHGQGHPDVEKIYDRVRQDFPAMSRATVYRNVILLKSLGEILELGFPDGSNRYDGNKPWPHPHVICVHCKKIIDPDLVTLEAMTEEVARKTDFQIVSHSVEFFGICRDCQKIQQSQD